MQVLSLLAPLAALFVMTVEATPAGYSPILQNANGARASEENKSLDQLYQEAIQEGGKLVVYHGGDTPTQQDWVAEAFRAAYPKINLTMVVDYSKYHNVRIDNQLATNSLVADVVALQTLQDYPRWKKQGVLLNYKPAGFSKIYPGFVDRDGAWAAHVVFAFSYFYDTALLNASGLPVPKTAKDLANPIYKDHIASSYPHDDDAALFVYAQYIEKYGWDWVQKLSQQNIQFERGSDTAGEAVGAKKKAIGLVSQPTLLRDHVIMSSNEAPSPLSDLGGDIQYEYMGDDTTVDATVVIETGDVKKAKKKAGKVADAAVKTTAVMIDNMTVPVAQVVHRSITTGKWDTGLFNCFDFCVPNCFMATFCPCISAAQIASRLGFRYQSALIAFSILVALECICYGLMLGTLHSTETEYTYSYYTNRYYYYEVSSTRLSFWAYIAYLISIVIFMAFWQLRTKVRSTFELPGSCVEDFLISFCCSCCALAQMATHVKSYKPHTCDFGPPDELPAYSDA